MKFIWNLLAIFGFVVLIGVGWFAIKFSAFDSGAGATYMSMIQSLLETGNAAEATVWKRKVSEDLSFEDVHESIKTVAEENNIKDVGFLPLGDQVGNMEGKPWRKLNIYLYCNPLTAKKMVEYSDAYAAYLPCRVSLLQDKHGKLWLYSLNMDMMIYGGKPLPPELKKEAIRVKKVILDIMDRAAKGDF